MKCFKAVLAFIGTVCSSCFRVQAPATTIAKFRAAPAYIPPVKGGHVIKVYDGDTFTIGTNIPAGWCSTNPYKFSVRLHGLDCPEIRSKNQEEAAAALMVRNELSNKIMHKYLTFKNVKLDKYGRVLADAYLGDVHINKWLLENRYAVEYDGGTKPVMTSWLTYMNKM